MKIINDDNNYTIIVTTAEEILGISSREIVDTWYDLTLSCGGGGRCGREERREVEVRTKG